MSLDPELLARLARQARQQCQGNGPAHDWLHVQRVVTWARHLGEAEGAREDVVVVSALLHELFNHRKDHPQSHLSGAVCARQATTLLLSEGCAPAFAEAVATCIREHPFSAGLPPTSLESMILQDADRLDAIGAIGVARCMATCAEMGRPFYHEQDPFCLERPPEDRRWGLDHFETKLLRIPQALHTARARAIAGERVAFMRGFLTQLEREIAPPRAGAGGDPGLGIA